MGLDNIIPRFFVQQVKMTGDLFLIRHFLLKPEHDNIGKNQLGFILYKNTICVQIGGIMDLIP